MSQTSDLWGGPDRRTATGGSVLGGRGGVVNLKHRKAKEVILGGKAKEAKRLLLTQTKNGQGINIKKTGNPRGRQYFPSGRQGSRPRRSKRKRFKKKRGTSSNEDQSSVLGPFPPSPDRHWKNPGR